MCCKGAPACKGSVEEDLHKNQVHPTHRFEECMGRVGKRWEGGRQRALLGAGSWWIGVRAGTWNMKEPNPSSQAVLSSLWQLASTWFCTTSGGSSEVSKPIGAASTLARVRGKSSPLPHSSKAAAPIKCWLHSRHVSLPASGQFRTALPVSQFFFQMLIEKPCFYIMICP